MTWFGGVYGLILYPIRKTPLKLWGVWEGAVTLEYRVRSYV